MQSPELGHLPLAGIILLHIQCHDLANHTHTCLISLIESKCRSFEKEQIKRKKKKKKRVDTLVVSRHSLMCS